MINWRSILSWQDPAKGILFVYIRIPLNQATDSDGYRSEEAIARITVQQQDIIEKIIAHVIGPDWETYIHEAEVGTRETRNVDIPGTFFLTFVHHMYGPYVLLEKVKQVLDKKKIGRTSLQQDTFDDTD